MTGRMTDKRSNERLDELRERLYAREAGPKKRERSALPDEPVEVATTWVKPPAPKPLDIRRPEPAVPPVEPEPVTETPSATTDEESPVAAFMPRKNKRNAIRFKLLIAGIFFFVLAVGVSSLFILFGGKAISGDIIAVAITGPFTIGGGEVLNLQLGVTNQNAIPVTATILNSVKISLADLSEIKEKDTVITKGASAITDGSIVEILKK